MGQQYMNSETNVMIVLGTRPEIIKLSPVIRACERHRIEYSVIHTGQHYSDSLDSVFFEQLELPTPEYHLGVGSDSHGQQTAAMIAGIEEIILETEPDVLLVQGDTNSVLAGAIAASKLDVELGHVEAGLRSFDREMPEETNRILTDHTADYLFAPTAESKQYLLDEGIDEARIDVVGNTVVDSVHQNQSLATEKSNVLDALDLTPEQYVLLTAHRAENVDSPDRFRGLLAGVSETSRHLDAEVIYPIHPRAENNLEEFDIAVPESVRVVEPQDYLDFLKLQANAQLILTDSGGVQEEACVLQVPCVTLRDNTERPETVDVGANELAGTEPERIVQNVLDVIDRPTDWENPFGDGTTSEQILETIIGQQRMEVIE